MPEKKSKRNKRIIIILAIVLAVLLIGTGVMAFYLADYSRAASEAKAVMADSSAVTGFDGGVAFGESNSQTGFIFYPGGKVEYTAYAPLMQEVAEGGVFCVVPEMPFNLAVFDSKAAEKVISKFPDIEQWYIGGHSLGGAMAADYAGKNPSEFAGLILLAAYSNSDISDSGLQVLSIYGSEDGVLNMENYTKDLSYLPSGYTEYRIEGGNHGQFGDYGLQDGDKTAQITPEEQWREASEEILKFIGTKEK